MQILDRLDQLAALGDRIGYSPEEDAAHALATGWFREAGLEVEVDAAGNLIGRIPGGTREIWTGSHLDTVPARGASTGRSVSSPGSRLSSVWERPASALSSSATRSAVAPAAAAPQHGRMPTSSCTSSRGRHSSAPTRRSASSPRSWATSAAGARSRARPATPARRRRTGARTRSSTAAEFVLHAREVAGGIGGAVATVGQVTVEPGGTNVIPGRVVVSVDARAPDAERLDRLAAALQIEEPIRTEPSPMSEEIRAALRAEVAALGLPVLELPSGAGHDAGILAAPASPPGCSSCAASTAASAIIRPN